MDAVYTDRNRAVMLAVRLAQLLGYTVGWREDADEPAWPVLQIELPEFGQVSWHLPNNELRGSWPTAGPWDGHSDEEKAKRILLFVLENGSE